MLDVFGLKKTGGEQPEPEQEPSSGPANPKLWAAALIVDSLFVIVFGGAVAAKVYQHWKAPAPDAAPRRAAAPPKAQKPPEPAKAAETKEEPAKPAPKAEAKPAPKPAEPPAKPLARPSVISEAPKRRATPAPQGTSVAQKAQPVEFKLKAPGAKKVYLVGAFIVRGGRKEMARGEGGAWTLTLYLTPNKYRYYFNVDGKRLSDPENPSSSIVVSPQ